MPSSTSWGTILRAPSRVTPEDVRRRKKEEERRRKKIRERIQKDALEERRLLEYVASHPGASSRRAYLALGIENATKGGDIRDVLEDERFIVVQRVRTLSLSGKGVVRASLFITPEGETYLRQLQEEAE